MRRNQWTSFLDRLGLSRRLRPRRARRGFVPAEALEARTLLTTTFFLDFGAALPAGGMSTTVEDFRDIDGPGIGGYGTGSDLAGYGGLVDSDQLDFNQVQYDYNGDAVIDALDAVALQNAVLPIVQRELHPFDIDVVAIGSSSFADVFGALQGNDAGMPGFDGFGENDAYNFVMEISSPDLAGSGLVGAAASLYGLAAGADFYGTGNNHDEATLTFTDTIVSATTGAVGTEFNENLAHRLAYTVVHEALHTFGLHHTRGLTTQERLLTSGDAIRSGSITRETDNIVTRFDLQLWSGAMVNNYDVLASDPDIGLRDSDHDGVPDLAYVTGTGAHDLIRLTDLGGGVTQVDIDAYLDSAMTTLIRSDSYTITLGVDTEGLILIDSSVGDDHVDIDAALTTGVMVRGGQGDDVIRGGSGNDRLFGEDGDDLIEGGAGNDWLFGEDGDDVINGNQGLDWIVGGAGHDRLNGNAGSDVLIGNDGDDELRGESGNDLLLGGRGDDRLFGDLGNDWLFGGNGRDVLFGGFGNDYLSGGNDSDVLAGNSGRDRLFGGNGNDALFGGLGRDLLRGGNGNDYLDGGAHDDTMTGGNGNDWMRGGDGNDQMRGGSGNDHMEGQAGNDRMWGGSGNDRMLGGDGRDRMYGGRGNDHMRGGNGGDLMFGGAGNDVMHGEAGNDFMIGGPGIDAVFGGPGIDLVFP